MTCCWAACLLFPMIIFSFVLALGLERSGAPEAYYYTALELIARVLTILWFPSPVYSWCDLNLFSWSLYLKLLHLVNFIDRYFIRVASVISISVYTSSIYEKKDMRKDLLLQHINNVLNVFLSPYLHLNSNLLQHLKLTRCSNIRSTVRTRDESPCTTCFPALMPCQVWQSNQSSMGQLLTTSVYKVLFTSVKEEKIPARFVPKIASFVACREVGGTK